MRTDAQGGIPCKIGISVIMVGGFPDSQVTSWLESPQERPLYGDICADMESDHYTGAECRLRTTGTDTDRSTQYAYVES